jgi:hypothetical protein
LRTALLLGFMGISALPARSQHIGDVSLTTTTQLLATGVTCTGNAQNFTVANLGQSFHLATAAIVTGGGSFGMEIDGIDAVANVFKISNPMITVGSSAFLVQGVGFMPIIRVSLTCTAGSTFSLSYSGSFAANPITNVGAGGSGNTTSITGGNVQGVIPTAQNGTPIFPVIGGSVQPAVNAQFLTFGLDTFGVSVSPQVPAASNGVATMVPPTPTNQGEFAIAFLTDSAVGTVNTLVAPWTCVIGSCINTSEPEIATLVMGTSNNLGITVTNASSPITPFATFLLLNKTPTIRQSARGNQTVTQVYGVNTLAGSTLVISVTCSTLQCSIAPTDTQGNTWRLVKLYVPGVAESGGASLAMSTWMAGPTSAAAETVTFNAAAGSTVNGSASLELTGATPANLNQPSAPLTSSNPKFQTAEDDPGGLFVNTAGFDYTQTITLGAAGTFLFPLWAESQHGLLQSCTVSLRITAASGTTPTLNTFLQDSADNVGFNDRLSMPQGTVTGNFLGSIPLFTTSSLAAVASSAVASTDGTLAAGSGIAGNLAAFGRIKFVTGGTTPSFTITYNVACR